MAYKIRVTSIAGKVAGRGLLNQQDPVASPLDFTSLTALASLFQQPPSYGSKDSSGNMHIIIRNSSNQKVAELEMSGTLGLVKELLEAQTPESSFLRTYVQMNLSAAATTNIPAPVSDVNVVEYKYEILNAVLGLDQFAAGGTIEVHFSGYVDSLNTMTTEVNNNLFRASMGERTGGSLQCKIDFQVVDV